MRAFAQNMRRCLFWRRMQIVKRLSSSETHVTTKSLKPYLKMIENGTAYPFEPSESSFEIRRVLASAIGFSLISAEDICVVFDIPMPKEIQNMMQELKAFCPSFQQKSNLTPEEIRK